MFLREFAASAPEADGHFLFPEINRCQPYPLFRSCRSAFQHARFVLACAKRNRDFLVEGHHPACQFEIAAKRVCQLDLARRFTLGFEE